MKFEAAGLLSGSALGPATEVSLCIISTNSIAASDFKFCLRTCLPSLTPHYIPSVHLYVCVCGCGVREIYTIL